MRKNYIFLFVIFFCSILDGQNQNLKYSFFVAGHTYGNPNHPQLGLHPPFVEVIPKINDHPTMEFGVLLGDVVQDSTIEDWDAAQNDIKQINMPVYIAAGNHDMGSEFTSRFGAYYYYFIHKNDLNIVLTPRLGNWSIKNQQKEFMINTIKDHANDVDNIFVFHHELIWWSPYNVLKDVIINYLPDYPGYTNFWNEIEPIFHSLQNNVVFYAGDLGATTAVSPFMYYSYDNITMIGTGMGGGVKDNIIISYVYNDTIVYDLYAINYEDPNALGELTDYSIINYIEPGEIKKDLLFFPNPVIDYLKINNIKGQLRIEVYNMNGRLLFLNETNNITSEINFSNWSDGFYLIKTIYNNRINTQKILKQTF